MLPLVLGNVFHVILLWGMGPPHIVLPPFFIIRRFRISVQVLSRTKYFRVSHFTLPQTRTSRSPPADAHHSLSLSSRSRPPQMKLVAVAVRSPPSPCLSLSAPRRLAASRSPLPAASPHRPVSSRAPHTPRATQIGQRVDFIASDELLDDASAGSTCISAEPAWTGSGSGAASMRPRRVATCRPEV